MRFLLLTPAIALVAMFASACPSATEPCPVGFVRVGDVCLRGCPPGSVRADGGCDCPDGLLSRDTPVGLVCEPPMDGGPPDMDMDAADMGALEDGSTDASAGDGADDAGACATGLPCELEGLECALGQTSCATGEETCELATAVDFGAACGRPACATCVCASGDCLEPLQAATAGPMRPGLEPLGGLGAVMAISEDGAWLAVGAPSESTAAGFLPGEGPEQDDGASGSGAVFVFRSDPGGWRLVRMLKARVPRAGDAFGATVAISAAGDVIAVGSPLESSGAGGELDIPSGTSLNSGAVHIFVDDFPPILLKADIVGAGDRFGTSVSLDSSGDVLVVGAPGDDSESETAPGTNGLTDSGAVHVYRDVRGLTGIEVAGYHKPSLPLANEGFGGRVVIAPGAEWVAVGVPNHSSRPGAGDSATDVRALSLRNTDAPSSGLVYLFGLRGSLDFEHVAVFRAENLGAGDEFGTSLAWAQGPDDVDRQRLVVGAPGEDGPGRGANPAIRDDGSDASGAVYGFDLDAMTQADYLKAPRAAAGQRFGTQLSSLESTLLVGAPGDQRSTTGATGPVVDNGAAFVFRLGSEPFGWNPAEELRPLVDVPQGRFGASVALSESSAVVAAPAPSLGLDAGRLYSFSR